MNLVSFLSVAIIVLLLVCCFMASKINSIKKQSLQILSVLDDIDTGNLGRRVVAHGEEVTNEICYKINKIAQTYQNQLSQAAKIEMTNRQLMTSLSHDVRTPLTTLIGYLDAIQDNVVAGAERKQYIETARTKAYALKGYTDNLFEWFKLNSKERKYCFEIVDLCEISRNVLSDWIPKLETIKFSYHADIPDFDIFANIDIDAYHRILNNLIQNAVEHSGGSTVGIAIKIVDDNVQIEVFDDGKGIAQSDLPYVFDRLYKADKARTSHSTGLGLSIVDELVKALDGAIKVDSVPNVKTVFTINMRKAR